MSEEHPVIPTRGNAGELLRKMLLQELTIGEGPIGQMDMLSILANAADWLDEAVAEDAVDIQSDYAYHTEAIPLYRKPPVTEPMPKEKRAEVCAGPLAWAAIRENGQPLWLSYDRSGAEGMVNGMAEVVPLYRQPTLTDAEREAVEEAADTADVAAEYFAFRDAARSAVESRHAATLRGLLERLGGGK